LCDFWDDLQESDIYNPTDKMQKRFADAQRMTMNARTLIDEEMRPGRLR